MPARIGSRSLMAANPDQPEVFTENELDEDSHTPAFGSSRNVAQA
jgi:hypothetical protein